jgi:hypothetical protein
MDSNGGLELSIINQVDSSLINNTNHRGIPILDSSLMNDIGNCYCCQESTDLRSPCVCRAHICDSCLITYVKYNEKCTICNSELDIYVPTPTSTIRSLSFSVTYSFEDEHFIDIIDIMKTLKIGLYIYYGISLIHYFGLFAINLLYNPNNFSYDYITFLIGIGYFFVTLLLFALICIFIFLIKELFICIWKIITCRCLRN